MKGFCVLLLFVAVNVLADNLASYKKQFVITNRQIQKVNSSSESGVPVNMKTVIKKLIEGDASMTRIVFMFAAPVPTDLKHLRKYIKYQKDLQKVITKVLGIHPVRDIEKKDFENCKLSDLGEVRRKLIIDVSNNLLKETAISLNLNLHPISRRQLCRVKGMFISIQTPKEYITETEVDEEWCYVTDINEVVKRIPGKGPKLV
ncbi:uncharacterized protein LOC126842564 [Adelges cooleyi]|uniref:uncharacterized protein LOC126842564 n=1 Tax=Adelges cooleyi TaxID=133065 RepID=UPI00217FE17F|nr:uncharacterized protein LOC126842564 [Adelges cooleyi]